MKRILECCLILVLLSACQRSPEASAAPQPNTSAAEAISTQRLPESATPSVTLPDFTALVDKAGPAVVTIEAEIAASEQATARRPAPGSDDEQMEEFFRRFFGGPPPSQQGPMPRGPQSGMSFGTGFIISADGYLLTNHHVVDNASKVRVQMSDRREYEAKVVGSDPLSDVALLKIEGKNLPLLPLGDSDRLKAGQWVVAIGSPFGFDHSVTAGVVSGTGRRSLDPSQQYVPFIQTDVAINRGNSGGPLINTRGEVVGINSQIFSNSGGYMGVSFAIPIEVAMNAVNQIRTTGSVTRGQLGVEIRDVNREDFAETGLDVARGAYVRRVNRGSSAERAGVQAGDVILTFNGKGIGSSSDLPPMVGATAPGSKVVLGVQRAGRRVELSATLTALSNPVAAADEATTAPSRADQSAGSGLGLRVGLVDVTSRRSLNLAEGRGVKIIAITGAMPQQAGLAVGDVILRVGREEVNSPADFARVAKTYKSGDTVRLQVQNENSSAMIAFPVE